MEPLKQLFKINISFKQIRALLWKDLIIHKRQPWMTFIQFLWPCIMCLAIYVVRFKYYAVDVDECQFPTRELPTKTSVLPFFQSYICSIDNSCSSPEPYNEISQFPDAPITPIVNIVQIFLNDQSLFDAIVDLPKSMNFIGSITAIVTNKNFKLLEENINKIEMNLPVYMEKVDNLFDVDKVWTDRNTFQKFGTILCGIPFPDTDSIPFIDSALYATDYKGYDPMELEAMPTEYCKNVYRNVASSNNGKITWNLIKPIIQGKILYGPNTEEIREIMFYSNDTFESIDRLTILVNSLSTIVQNLQKDGPFKNQFNSLLALAKSPFIRKMIENFHINATAVEGLLTTLTSDHTVLKLIQTASNMLGCFSVDRFIPVNSESELESMAFKLNEQKLFYGGVYFTNNSANNKEYNYKIRMEIDNSPITLENKNRFWFPGPDGDFKFDLKYHRGFIQFQHNFDLGIIRHVKKSQFNRKQLTENDEHLKRKTLITESNEINEHITTIMPIVMNRLLNETNIIGNNQTHLDADVEDFLNFNDNHVHNGNDTIVIEKHDRQKKSPQFGDLFSMLLGGQSTSNDKSSETVHFDVDTVRVYTKQFPYPKYRKDVYKTGIYLAQAIQMTFFFVLIIQVASAVRNRIWLRESGNFMLMQIMGLKKSSEFISWFISCLCEISIVIFITTAIYYAEGLLITTSVIFLAYFLLLFGIGVIAFCYMTSTFFSSATIGSVSSVIIFLITFTPYIVIISLGKSISMFVKILASFSIATPFCYVWQTILRTELQQKSLTFYEAHQGSFDTNDIKFGITMIVIDIILYLSIGYLHDKHNKEECHFQNVTLKNMDNNIGAAMKNVSKEYINGKLVVDNISICFKRNYITCLLGRNGAGKSTIIKLLTGQSAPTTGTVYWPQNLDTSGNEYHDQIGLCPQNRILIPNLTAKEHLQLYASIKLNDRENMEVNRVLRNLNFGKYEQFNVDKLSGGFQRRLNVAIAFLGSPNLVILDEPCSGVDSKTRRVIWDLISILKQNRAVVLATHYLDEAEHLSDNILILNQGKIISENNPDKLRDQFTKSFDLHIHLSYLDHSKTIEEIKEMLNYHTLNYNVHNKENQDFIVNIKYRKEKGQRINFAPLIQSLESLKKSGKIDTFKVISKDLESIFNAINKQIECETENQLNSRNGNEYNNMMLGNGNNNQAYTERTEFDVIKSLFWKRLKHFQRNYRLIVSVFVMPIIFEITAMALLKIRAPDEYGVALEFSRNLYSNSTEFYSYEHENFINEKTINNIQCDYDCKIFNTSERAFHWLLDTNEQYIERRYGGLSINDSIRAVWYNNKGYHAMPVYLNELNTAQLRAELNDSELNIRTTNHPIKLGRKEISNSSILQQAADAGIAFILLVAFSYVIAHCSVYIVNERISGEKLQQKLCGVSFRTYWGVAFIWDLFIYSIALLLAAIILVLFENPVFTARENLSGTCLLLFLFGFATIPMVHLAEKLFNDGSLAAMYTLCMNIVIGLVTANIIILFDILGTSDEAKTARDILNNLFMVFPQHAFGDGLIQLSKNYLTANTFERFYIDTYKSPVYSDLLRANYIVFLSFGIIFMVINYIIESRLADSWLNKIFKKKEQCSELQNIVSNGQNIDRKYDLYGLNDVLKVTNLKKIYKGNHQAIHDISFEVQTGECFGLMGTNGAGKSTIFSILSGQLRQSGGTIELFGNKIISYCPQSNALDNLLTVEEVIYFYAKLRCIRDINEIINRTLRSFHLEAYRKTLVKNLSGGNKRKLSVAVTCFGNTSLVLMDEPTSDMDPVTRSLVYSSINRLINEKRSVILTSHTITEIDRVCHRIAIIKNGKMLSIGTPKMLKETFGNSYLVTIFFDHIEALSIERDIKTNIPELENLVLHNYCLQFTIKIKSINDQLTIPEQFNEGILLSELFERLYRFSIDRGISYTVTECMLNQALERIFDTEDCDGAFYNPAYVHSESVT